MFRSAAFVGVLVGTLTACSPSQLTDFTAGAGRVSAALESACATALSLSHIGRFVPGVSELLPWVETGCNTAEGLAKLAADPSSVEWVGTLSGKITALIDAFRRR